MREAAPGPPGGTSREEGVCVWLTGLSAAGKTTIGDVLAKRLVERGREVSFLDGDLVRTHLSRGLGFSREDRDANVRRVGFVAAEIVRHRGAVICAVISPYEAARNECRAMVGEDRFVLVWVATPLAECERRDPKGLYARARRGEIAGFTGIDDPYEPPARPDLVLDTSGRQPEECVRTILRYLEARGLLAADPV